MKVLGAFALGFLLMAGTGQLRAGVIAFELNFDQGGDATYMVPSTIGLQNGYTALAGTATAFTEADPLGDTGGQVLVYDLPFDVVSGPVGVYAFGTTNVVDVLWFTNSSGVSDGGLDANEMIFYSIDATSAGTLAGAPGELPTDIDYSTLDDITAENALGGFQWLPDTFAYPNGNEYDEVAGTPEPASMVLFGSGVAGLMFMRRKRRTA